MTGALALLFEKPPAMQRADYRERVVHAELCMEEAAIITWAVSGMTVCAHIVANDLGLGQFVPLDASRLFVWSVLSFGFFRHRAWPAYVLLLDIVGRFAVGGGDPLMVPAAAFVGALTIRGLLARLDAEDPPPLPHRF